MAPKKAPTTARTDRHPFLLSIEEVATQLGTSTETGLSARKVQELQKGNPKNELEGRGGTPWYSILLKQCSNAMILVGSLPSIDSQFFFSCARRRKNRLLSPPRKAKLITDRFWSSLWR